jgi:hypothetical protein
MITKLPENKVSRNMFRSKTEAVTEGWRILANYYYYYYYYLHVHKQELSWVIIITIITITIIIDLC